MPFRLCNTPSQQLIERLFGDQQWRVIATLMLCHDKTFRWWKRLRPCAWVQLSQVGMVLCNCPGWLWFCSGSGIARWRGMDCFIIVFFTQMGESVIAGGFEVWIIDPTSPRAQTPESGTDNPTGASTMLLAWDVRRYCPLVPGVWKVAVCWGCLGRPW